MQCSATLRCALRPLADASIGIQGSLKPTMDMGLVLLLGLLVVLTLLV